MGNFPHKPVYVRHALYDAGNDSLEVEGVQAHADGFNTVLQDPHRRLKALPALGVVHGLAALVDIYLLAKALD